MNKYIEEILLDGWHNIENKHELEHQVLERVIKRVVKAGGITQQDVEWVIEDLREWHLAGLLTDPRQESPPPEGLLLRTSLLENSPDWIDILKDNPQAIEQTVMDPTFSSVVGVARKFETAYNREVIVKLFETCLDFYASRGADTADLGIRKAIQFWDGLEDGPDMDEILDRKKEKLVQLYTLCTEKLPTHTLVSYVRKNQLEKLAGQHCDVKKKPLI